MHMLQLLMKSERRMLQMLQPHWERRAQIPDFSPTLIRIALLRALAGLDPNSKPLSTPPASVSSALD